MYIPKDNFYKTVTHLSKIKSVISSEFSKHFNLIKINAPLFYNSGTRINDVNWKISEPKYLYFANGNLLVELSSGCRKWSVLLATNMGLVKNNALYCESITSDFLNGISNTASISNEILTLTFPINKEERNWTSLKKTTKDVIKILNTLLISLNNKKIFSNKIKFHFFEDINYNGEAKLIFKIKSLFTKNNNIVVVCEIPNESYYKNFFFLNDVYDWNYFVQIYVKHVYTKKILKICEISFNPTKESLLRQLSAEKINLDKFSFYNLYNNNKIKYYCQIMINMSLLNMYLLKKYSINEIHSSPLTKKLGSIYIDNNLKIF